MVRGQDKTLEIEGSGILAWNLRVWHFVARSSSEH